VAAPKNEHSRTEMQKRGFWKTRFGFYLAAMGSAFGLGNLWRFPYVAGENGGGAFVLLYVFLALLIGLPLLVGELMLGKSSKQSVLTATSQLIYKEGRPFRWIGRFSVALTLVVLSYYAVISGWVLHFLTQFTMSFIADDMELKGSLALLQSNGLLQIGLASVHILLAVVVVIRGVQEGLERWIGAMMPAFGILLALLMIKSLALPSSAEAMRFLFYPDFSRLNWSSLVHAIGHVLFTLSVGFGTMVTFGSYLKDSDHIPTAGFRVTLVDTFLSLIAGLLIFPIVLSASNIPMTDPGLLFEALPRFLLQMKGGLLFGLAFFLCLYLAALGASIGLLEVIVSNWVDRLKMKRSTAGWLSGALALGIAIVPATSGSLLKNFRAGDKGLLENLDSILINWCLPLIALGMSFAIAWGMRAKDKERLFVDLNKIESSILFPHWTVVIKWVVPITIVAALLLQMIGLWLGR
jgi:neurotransmitter:Na+ symporter, NSS family